MRKIKYFCDTNTTSMLNRFETFVEENQQITIEHMTSFDTRHMSYVVITYFEPKPL